MNNKMIYLCLFYVQSTIPQYLHIYLNTTFLFKPLSFREIGEKIVIYSNAHGKAEFISTNR